jgi:hypothetical protein
LKEKGEPAVKISDYADGAKEHDISGPPLELTMRQAIAYVNEKISRRRSVYKMSNDQLMMDFTNIKFEGKDGATNFPVTYEYVSWYTVICEMLKKHGVVREYRYSGHGGYEIVPW